MKNYNSSSNETTGGTDHNHADVVFYGALFRDLVFVAYIITFFFGVVGNAIVCYVLFTRKQKKKSIHLLTMNLSMSDLIVSTIYLPMQMYLINTQLKWGLGDFMCRALNGINSLTVNASIGTLVVITFDRYNAVVKPMVTHSRNTVTTKVLIGVIWVTSFALTIPLILVAKIQQGYCSESWPDTNYEQGYWTLAFVLQFVLPMIYISSTYIAIICAVKTSHSELELVQLHDDTVKREPEKTGILKKNKQLKMSENCNNNNNSIGSSMSSLKNQNGTLFNQQTRGRLKRKKQQSKLLKMSVILVIAYCVCALPQHAVYFAMTYSDFYLKSYSVMLFVLANFLMAVNSALNPVIYGTLNDEMKKGLKRMVSTSDNRLVRNISNSIGSFRKTIKRRRDRANTECSVIYTRKHSLQNLTELMDVSNVS